MNAPACEPTQGMPALPGCGRGIWLQGRQDITVNHTPHKLCMHAHRMRWIVHITWMWGACAERP